MSPEVDPEERAALADAAGGGKGAAGPRIAVVTPRDFTEPRTLSADRIARIRKTLSARLQVIANDLAGPMRGHPTLTVGEVAEINSLGLFDDFERPFLVYGFPCEGGLGWAIWDTEAARLACDTVLSGPPAPPEKEGDPFPVGEPQLSRTERRVIASMIDDVLQRIGHEFELQIAAGDVWQEPEELTTMEDLGPDGDARRLLVHLGFETDFGHQSDLRIYLPGIAAQHDQGDDEKHSAAPPHLAGMDLELAVNLGSAEVPLSDLLAIEIGDVIPLDTRVGALAALEIEEETYAYGRCGTAAGLLAVQIDSIRSYVDAVDPDNTQSPGGSATR